MHLNRRRPWPARLWVILVAAIVSVSGVWAEESSPYGINVHAPTGEQLGFLFDKVEAAGIGWVRIDFVWALIERQPDVFDWSLYDEIVLAAQLRGLQVLAIIAYTPGWATDGPAISGVPRAVMDWEDFCFRSATRYGQTIRHWEIWNEPNQPHFWDGTRGEYIDLILGPAADAIRMANPDARVGGPGLAHLVSDDRDWYWWLLDVLERAADRLDFATHHLYDSDGHQDVTAKLEDETPFGQIPELWFLIPPSVREVLVEAEWFGDPFWLTESGWASDEVGEVAQATYYEGLLDQWLTGDPVRGWIDKILFYEVQDDPSPGVPLWGILRANGSEKPAYAAYRDFIGTDPLDDIFQDGFESGDLSAWSGGVSE